MTSLALLVEESETFEQDPLPQLLINELHQACQAYERSTKEQSPTYLSRVAQSIIRLSDALKNNPAQFSYQLRGQANDYAQWYRRTAQQTPLPHSTSQDKGLSTDTVLRFKAFSATEFIAFYATGQQVMNDYTSLL